MSDTNSSSAEQTCSIVTYVFTGKGRCFNVYRDGNVLLQAPRPMLAGVSGNGLYIAIGSRVYDGKGLLLGPRSPFRNIPILKWIL